MANSNVKTNISEARNALIKLKPFKLKRDVFFVHGWSDEANVGWTYPYVETSDEDRNPNWKYSIKDWIDEKVINKERAHYIKLVKDEQKIKIERDKRGKISVDIDGDETYYYESFFEFAELLKEKVESVRTTDEIDLVGHSMGGLDAVAAIAVDKKQDSTKAIKRPCLKDVNLLITVATPHQGSPCAKLSDTKLDKILLRKSDYIRKQGRNMDIKSSFMQLINRTDIRNQLLQRISFMHMFGGGSDPVVPRACYKINTIGLKVKNYKIYPAIYRATHSQVMGITQRPETSYEIFKLLML